LSEKQIVVAGATGRLGGLIIEALRERGAPVRAVVRPTSEPETVARLKSTGAEIAVTSYGDAVGLRRACQGAACVVSALAGLRETIVDAQSALLDAAVAVSVPRFIPSDFAIDFYKMPPGGNRNLDLRREFSRRLDAAPIKATSILNGMFMDLLAGDAPFILTRFHRVVYWENPDQAMDFTTIEDTAAFTAAAALDPSTPRFLRIAGAEASARDLARIAEEVAGQPFRLFRAGPLQRFKRIIRFTRLVAPGRNDVYPPWQGMQYMHDMFDGRAKLIPLDNARYPGLRWTPIEAVLSDSPIPLRAAT
jgi:nucleoside-diphosphate-sugar epimerase